MHVLEALVNIEVRCANCGNILEIKGVSGNYHNAGPREYVIKVRSCQACTNPPYQVDTIAPERRRVIQANQFAAALLMPQDLVREHFATGLSVDALAESFGVSKQVMAIRLAQLGLI